MKLRWTGAKKKKNYEGSLDTFQVEDFDEAYDCANVAPTIQLRSTLFFLVS